MAETKHVEPQTLASLIDGKLAWEEVKKLLRLDPKDADRFQVYRKLLQERVPWREPVLLRLADHLYIVRTNDGRRVVRCDCGFEFGDYRENWKLAANVHVRTTKEEFREVYQLDTACPEPGLIEIREFYCPGCWAQLAVECTPPGTMAVFEMLPDLDAFYREWLAEPLADESPDWFRDRTNEVTARWRSEAPCAAAAGPRKESPR
ncbi:MAG: acetone carboxylase subunit gamma [Deltaproteobacteria bacterium]|nr:acetone carboxylase subunit gamma [Deltaproteobacteria bacterium]